MATQTLDRIEVKGLVPVAGSVIEGDAAASPASPEKYGDGYAVREVGPYATAAAFGGDMYGRIIPPTGRTALAALIPEGSGLYSPPTHEVPPANYIG